MQKEYEELRNFWDKALTIKETDTVKERWIQDEVFNNTLDTYFKDGNAILDYGCGSGWATFELALAFKQSKLVGIDPSFNAIDFCNRCMKASDFKNIKFINGDQTNLNDYENCFDNIVTFNVIDVIPDNIIDEVLTSFSKLIKKNGTIIIGINPDFNEEFYLSRGFVRKNGYLYKDNILRGNEKSTAQWIELFNKYFNVIETKTFTVVEQEKQYPRRMFVLKTK